MSEMVPSEYKPATEVVGKKSVWEYLDRATDGGLERVRASVLDGSFPRLFYNPDMTRQGFAADIHLVSTGPEIGALTRDELVDFKEIRRGSLWDQKGAQPVLDGSNGQKYAISGMAGIEQVADGIAMVNPTWMITEEARQIIESHRSALSYGVPNGPNIYQLALDLYCKPNCRPGKDYTRLTLEFGRMWRLRRQGIEDEFNFDVGSGRLILEGNTKKDAKLLLSLGNKTGKNKPEIYIKMPVDGKKPVEIGFVGKWRWKLRKMTDEELINELRVSYGRDGKETFPRFIEALNFTLGNDPSV